MLYAVVLFYQAWEIGDEDRQPTEWVYRGTRVYKTRLEQMTAYAEIPCPASQAIEAETAEELKQKIDELITNFRNEAWLNEFIYPYI